LEDAKTKAEALVDTTLSGTDKDVAVLKILIETLKSNTTRLEDNKISDDLKTPDYLQGSDKTAKVMVERLAENFTDAIIVRLDANINIQDRAALSKTRTTAANFSHINISNTTIGAGNTFEGKDISTINVLNSVINGNPKVITWIDGYDEQTVTTKNAAGEDVQSVKRIPIKSTVANLQCLAGEIMIDDRSVINKALVLAVGTLDAFFDPDPAHTEKYLYISGPDGGTITVKGGANIKNSTLSTVSDFSQINISGADTLVQGSKIISGSTFTRNIADENGKQIKTTVFTGNGSTIAISDSAVVDKTTMTTYGSSPAQQFKTNVQMNFFEVIDQYKQPAKPEVKVDEDTGITEPWDWKPFLGDIHLYLNKSSDEWLAADSITITNNAIVTGSTINAQSYSISKIIMDGAFADKLRINGNSGNNHIIVRNNANVQNSVFNIPKSGAVIVSDSTLANSTVSVGRGVINNDVEYIRVNGDTGKSYDNVGFFAGRSTVQGSNITVKDGDIAIENGSILNGPVSMRATKGYLWTALAENTGYGAVNLFGGLGTDLSRYTQR